MSDIAKDVKLSLKVMINKEKTKVLFAEAGTDLANVLLSFLTFPLGRIVKLLEKHYAEKSPVFGSITSLYKGLANLDDIHFSTPAAKIMLLDPRGSFDSLCRNLKVDISDSTPTKYFICEVGFNCVQYLKNVTMHYGTARYECGRPLNKEILIVSDCEGAGVFTMNNASFIISEDLQMVPYSMGYFKTLSNLGFTGAVETELLNVTLGIDEIMNLLKCCLPSTTPLTDFLLNKGEIFSSPAKPEPGYFLHKIEKEKTKAILKVMVHKSTNKVLFAQAEDDFIELLFNFLLIPVATAESLLDTNTRLNSFDNLYRSITDVGIAKYFITLDTKKRLMNPSLPHFYKSKNTFLPLIEESGPKVFYRNRVFFLSDNGAFGTSLMSPKGNGNYVMGPKTFMVTDDLTVSPFCFSTSFSLLERLNIPISDVDELEVPIGLQEGLSILKASLTSTSALTDGLINHIMRKQPGPFWRIWWTGLSNEALSEAPKLIEVEKIKDEFYWKIEKLMED